MGQELILLCGNGKSRLLEQAVEILQKKNLCNGCRDCKKCLLISQWQDPQVRLFEVQGHYTLQHCDQILSTTALQLPEGETFFFVLSQVENLLPNAANRLLKTLEEPPSGYNFIFTTTNKNAVLPTILSRCTSVKHYDFEENQEHPLFLFFTQDYSLHDIASLNTTLSALDDFGEIDSQIVFQAVWEHFLRLSIDGKAGQGELARLAMFEKYSQFPPRPGGVRGFWQCLFLDTT